MHVKYTERFTLIPACIGGDTMTTGSVSMVKEISNTIFLHYGKFIIEFTGKYDKLVNFFQKSGLVWTSVP